jgi:hypothetical protein
VALATRSPPPTERVAQAVKKVRRDYLAGAADAVVVATLVFQRHFVSGLTRAAVKG